MLWHKKRQILTGSRSFKIDITHRPAPPLDDGKFNRQNSNSKLATLYVLKSNYWCFTEYKAIRYMIYHVIELEH